VRCKVVYLHLGILTFNNLLDQTIKITTTKLILLDSYILVEGLIKDFNEMITVFSILPSMIIQKPGQFTYSTLYHNIKSTACALARRFCL
jgi:hypothetical protein